MANEWTDENDTLDGKALERKVSRFTGDTFNYQVVTEAVKEDTRTDIQWLTFMGHPGYTEEFASRVRDRYNANHCHKSVAVCVAEEHQVSIDMRDAKAAAEATGSTYPPPV